MSNNHSLEFNKIAGGILLAGLIAMTCSFIASGIYGEHDEKEKRGFSVEVPEEGEAGTEVAVVEEVDIMELLAVADAANGEKEAKKRCASCHTFEKGGADKTGPNLNGISNKAIAGGSFPYSGALKEVSGKWDYESLNKWLTNPQKVAKGSKMVLKVKKDAIRADIIKYLDTLK